MTIWPEYHFETNMDTINEIIVNINVPVLQLAEE